MGACDESAMIQSAEPEYTAAASTALASEPTGTAKPSLATAASPSQENSQASSAEPASEPVKTTEPAPHTLAPVKDSSRVYINSKASTLLIPTSGESTYVLTLGGLEYDTGVKADGVSCYVTDIDLDGTSEILLVSPRITGAELYLFQPGPGELRGATFTYTLPEQLSDNGEFETHTDAACLIFSGIEPLVALDDGSFAVLAFGNSFERYVFDAPTMRVIEAEPLPLDILTGGEIPALDQTVSVSAG